eukprot:13612795-Ditylum_brightwellii.AAC.1
MPDSAQTQPELRHTLCTSEMQDFFLTELCPAAGSKDIIRLTYTMSLSMPCGNFKLQDTEQGK